MLLSLINTPLACNGTDARKANYMEEGKQLFKAGDYKNAKMAFDNAVACEPGDIESRYEIAEQLSKMGDSQDAIDHYQAIVNQDVKHVMARVRAGQIYLFVSKIDLAEKMAKEALAIDPENTGAMGVDGGRFGCPKQ